jgi:hypothetical protein
MVVSVANTVTVAGAATGIAAETATLRGCNGWVTESLEL